MQRPRKRPSSRIPVRGGPAATAGSIRMASRLPSANGALRTGRHSSSSTVAPTSLEPSMCSHRCLPLPGGGSSRGPPGHGDSRLRSALQLGRRRPRRTLGARLHHPRPRPAVAHSKVRDDAPARRSTPAADVEARRYRRTAIHPTPHPDVSDHEQRRFSQQNLASGWTIGARPPRRSVSQEPSMSWRSGASG